MLTIFTIPKPFVGHVGVIQRNAVRSWVALEPTCEVILFGDDEGVSAFAEELGVTHVPGIPRTPQGTPILDGAFARAEELAGFPHLCYVNADIILPASFTPCMRRVRLRTFLAVGQRLDVDVVEELDFDSPAARSSFDVRVAREAKPHAFWGSDYFVFPRGALGTLPPFAVGRPGWDNWMIYRARQLRVPVVDASGTVLVIHQNHSYGHVPNATAELWEGPEADANRSLLAPEAGRFTPRNATWCLNAGRLERRWWWSRGRRVVLHEAAALHPRWRRAVLIAGAAESRLTKAANRMRSHWAL